MATTVTLTNAVQGARHETIAVTWGIDLTGATITGTKREAGYSSVTVLDGSFAITDAAAGIFTWTLGAGDVGAAGEFRVQFKAQFANYAMTVESEWTVYENQGTGEDAAGVLEHVTADQRGALDAANDPGSDNPIATINDLAGQVAYDFLNANTSAGATSATLRALPVWLAANAAWIVIDPYTIEAEVRKITGVVGSAVTWSGGLTYTHADDDPIILLSSAVLDVQWFGAKGDGVTNDRVAWNRAMIQADLIGGAIVDFLGTFNFTPLGVNPQMINLSGMSNITIQGHGPASVLQLDPNYDWANSEPDAHMFLCIGSQNITFRDFKIDGRWRDIQVLPGVVPEDFNEQIHGFYLGGLGVYGQTAGPVRNITIENVWMYNIRGDGWYCVGDSDNTVDGVSVIHCQVTDGGRSGGAHQSVINLLVEDCDFSGNDDQDLDFEITSARPMSQIRVKDNRFNHDNDTICVAFTGFDSNSLMSDVWFYGNHISRGGMMLRYVEHVYIYSNTIKGSQTAGQAPAIGMTFGLQDVWIFKNYLEGNIPAAEPVVSINPQTTGTNERVYLLNNTIVQNHAGGLGIFAVNVADTLVIAGNEVIGAGGSTSVSCVGIDCGNQLGPALVYNHRYNGNHIKNFRYALKVAGTTTRQIDGVEVCDNYFYDDQGTPTQLFGIRLDGSNFVVGGRFKMAGNTMGPGVTTPLSNDASIPYWVIGGNPGGVALYQIASGSPEGVIAAPVSSVALRADGGVSTTLYIKTSGTGNTGWTAVQGVDPELTALAGLTSAADKLPYFTGSGTAAVADFTEFGRSLVDDANAAAALTTLGAAAAADVIPKNASILSKSGAYQLAAGDEAKIIECNGTFTITCPNGLSTGFQVAIANVGTGVITIAAAGTLQSKGGLVTLPNQYGMATIYHRGSNVWLLAGDLA